MKSSKVEKRLIFECNCGSPDHLFVIDRYENDFIVHFTSNWKAVWYKRVWYSLRYIFAHKSFSIGDEICLDSLDARDLIKYFKDYIKEKK